MRYFFAPLADHSLFLGNDVGEGEAGNYNTMREVLTFRFPLALRLIVALKTFLIRNVNPLFKSVRNSNFLEEWKRSGKEKGQNNRTKNDQREEQKSISPRFNMFCLD